MYVQFAHKAEEEGFARAADTFNTIIVAENHHEELFLHLADICPETGLCKKDSNPVALPELRVYSYGKGRTG